MLDHHEISTGEVLVLQAPIDVPDTDFQRHRESLTPAELERASKYRHTNRQRAFIVARGLVRSVLGRWLGLRPHDVPLQTSRAGKPELANSQTQPLHFTISHSRNMAVVGFSLDVAIGVDVEESDAGTNVELIARNYFRSAEQNLLLNAAPDSLRSTFYRIWTCKEAAWKTVGEESVMRWNDLEVSFQSDARSTIQVANQRQRQLRLVGHTWSCAGSVISVVTSSPVGFAAEPRLLVLRPNGADESGSEFAIGGTPHALCTHVSQRVENNRVVGPIDHHSLPGLIANELTHRRERTT